MSKVDEFVADLLGKDLTLARDYASIINWDVGKIAKWTSEWTDFSITDPGILFANADGYMYDMINYNLDETYLNNILRYTKSEEALYFMSKFVGLELPSWESSIATVKISNPTRIPVPVPRDYPIYVRDSATGEELWFYNLEEVIVPTHAYIRTKMIEGKRTIINTTFGDFDEFFRFIIPSAQVATNGTFVFAKVLGSDEWTEFVKIDDAFLNTGEDLCFSVHYAYDKTIIKFPPGIRDYLPDTAEVKIVFGVPSGTKGNVGKLTAKPGEALIFNNTEFQDLFTFEIEIADGAQEPLSLEDTRVFIGNNSWRVDTLATTADFNNLTAQEFPEIIRFATKQEQGVEKMDVYFLPKEDVSVDRVKQIKDELIVKCEPLMFGGTQLNLDEMGYQVVAFAFDITLGNNSSDLADLRSQVEDIITEYLDRETQEPEMLIRRSYLVGQIEDRIKEVSNASCSSPSSDIKAPWNTIFVVGGINITFHQKGKVVS